MNTDSVLHTTQVASRKAVQDALDASKKLQQALTRRAERLEVKLKAVDELLEAADVDEGEDDPEPEVLIPGAKKAAGLFPLTEFLNSSSPFYERATKRTNYIANTRPHPMKAKDIEALATAVRQENERFQSYILTQPPDFDAMSIDLDSNVEGLDWNRIAEKVSDSSSVKRTPTECRVIWIGDRHPRINHGEWHRSEIDKLTAIVQEYLENKMPIDWAIVAERLGTNRTPIDCMRHGSPQHRHNWTAEADQKLLDAVESCGIDNWQLVARKVSEYVTASQCQGRWQKTLNPSLKRGAWTSEEDELLRKAVAGYGNSWVQVATAVPGRTNDQCRERWTEYLKPAATSTTWSEVEDKYLFELVASLGNKWATISARIGNNKTGQNCRLRYEKLKRMKKNESQGLVTHIISSLSPAQPPTVSGISQLVLNPKHASFVSVSGFADMAPQSDPVERSSSSKNEGATANPQSSLTTQESPEIAPMKPRPKPRPRRSKIIGQAAGSSNTCVADIASGAISSMRGELSQTTIPTTSIVDKETSSRDSDPVPVPAATMTYADTAPLPTGSTKGGKRKVVGRRKALAEPASSRDEVAPSKYQASSNPDPIQDNERDDSNQTSLKRTRKKRAPKLTGRPIGVDPADADSGSSNAAPVQPSEEIGHTSASSTRRKRKTAEHTEDQTNQNAAKKARVTRSKVANPKKSTANQVVPPEPSYDLSQLRRGRSRKTLSPSLHPESVPGSLPSANLQTEIVR